MPIHLTTGESASVMYHTDRGVKPAFAIGGRKFIRVITIEPELRMRRVPLREARYMKPLDVKPSRWRTLARRAGTSKTIRKLLLGGK